MVFSTNSKRSRVLKIDWFRPWPGGPCRVRYFRPLVVEGIVYIYIPSGYD